MEIQSRYIVSPKPQSWDSIEEVVPDETDLSVLKEIENDPDCHEFVSEKEAMMELGL